MNKLSHRPQNLNIGERNKHVYEKKRSEAQQRYMANPYICAQCEQVIPYEKRGSKPKFCSRSCSATHQNLNRTPESNEKRRLSITKTCAIKYGTSTKPYDILIIDGKRRRSICKIFNKQCLGCSGNFVARRVTQQYCNKICRLKQNTITFYRLMCKFKVNNVEHGELFNGELIKQYGWYCPTNKGKANLTGVCWDHLFRIEDGYKLAVDPAIMSHPANAELVPWVVNKNRKQSMITYQQLLERIEMWNAGNRNLPTFYKE